MKKNVMAVFALAVLSVTACKKETVETTEVEVTTPADSAVKYVAQAADSKIEWVGEKVAGAHNGTITIQEGEVFVNEGKVTNGKFIIDMNSITVLDLTKEDEKAGLEAHLKGLKEDNADHFFNVAKYPTSTFEITSVTEDAGKQIVEGNLTIKDKTNPVKFPAAITVTDNDVTIVSDEFAIDRTKYGVNYNSGTAFTDLAADKVIKDEIKIKISVKAVK